MAIIIDGTENKRVVFTQDVLVEIKIVFSSAGKGSWPRRRSGCVKNVGRSRRRDRATTSAEDDRSAEEHSSHSADSTAISSPGEELRAVPGM